MLCCILGSKCKYHRELRIKTWHSSGSTLAPVALKGQSHCAGTQKPTHALIQAARNSVRSVKQPATKHTHGSEATALQGHRLFFTTALRIYDSSKLYFGKKTPTNHLMHLKKPDLRSDSNGISPPDTHKGH